MPCSDVHRAQDEIINTKFLTMKKMELNQMENIHGGDQCLLAGGAAVLIVAGTVLSGGAVAAGLLAWGGSMLGVLSACAKELNLQ